MRQRCTVVTPRVGLVDRSRHVLTAALLLALLVGLSSPAHAEPPRTPSQGEVDRSKAQVATAAEKVGRAQAQLAVADAQLEELSREVARAVEAYNGAVVLLEAAQASAAQAQAAAADARADLEESRDALGRFAAASYRSGGDVTGVATVLSADGLRSLVDRSNALSTVGERYDDILDEVRVSKVVADLLDRQASQALDEQEAATAAVEAAKQEAQAKVAAQQQQVAALESLRAAATSDLASAQSKSTQLERLRQEGLAREAAERARREQAAAAQRAAQRAAQLAAARATTSSPRPSAPAPSSTGRPSSSSQPSTPPAPPIVVGGGSSRGTTDGAARAIEYARAQIGKPYQWAADGPESFDCSGLTQMAWRAGGVSLPHWSVGQYAQGLKIPASQARPGDLVFFGDDPSDPSSIFHVGLYVGGGRMIEAPYTGANVRESSVNRSGFIGYARP